MRPDDTLPLNVHSTRPGLINPKNPTHPNSDNTPLWTTPKFYPLSNNTLQTIMWITQTFSTPLRLYTRPRPPSFNPKNTHDPFLPSEPLHPIHPPSTPPRHAPLGQSPRLPPHNLQRRPQFRHTLPRNIDNRNVLLIHLIDVCLKHQECSILSPL